jgi:hypothetical protein
MKRIALALTLLAATAACNGTTPTDISPSFDGSVMGSGVGAQSEDDGSGTVGSGCCAATASSDNGSIAGSGGRTGVVGPSGG